MDDLIVLLKVLNLLHDLFENFGAVLWRIAVFYKADLDLQLQLIADVLIVQPVSKRRFGIDDLFDLLRQSLALVVDDNTVNLFIGSVSISCFLFDRNLLCVAAPRIIRTTVELAILSPAANQKSTALWAYFLLCQNCNIPNHMSESKASHRFDSAAITALLYPVNTSANLSKVSVNCFRSSHNGDFFPSRAAFASL